MVQRLSEVKAGPKSLYISPEPYKDNPFSRHPELAVLAMGAISSWSNIEETMVDVFVKLLGGNRSLATDIYLTFEGEGPKNVAVDTAANAILDRDHLELLRAIMDLKASAAKTRHKLAHWTWCDSPNIPDGVLLTDEKSGRRLGHQVADHVYVYKTADFQQILNTHARLFEFSSKLSMLIDRRGTPEGGQLFQRLSAEPEIQEQLARRKARRDRANT